MFKARFVNFYSNFEPISHLKRVFSTLNCFLFAVAYHLPTSHAPFSLTENNILTILLQTKIHLLSFHLYRITLESSSPSLCPSSRWFWASCRRSSWCSPPLWNTPWPLVRGRGEGGPLVVSKS